VSYKEFARKTDVALRDTDRPDHRCPAHGCPNAASVSFDGSRWACFHHAKAAPHEWPQVTEHVLRGWPETANWGLEKAAYEAERAAKRRAERSNQAIEITAEGSISDVLEKVLA